MRQLAALGSNRVLIVVLLLRQVQKTPLSRGVLYLAEKEGFEPSMGLLTPYSLSRGAPSATRPLLRNSVSAVNQRFRCTPDSAGHEYAVIEIRFSGRPRIITVIAFGCQNIWLRSENRPKTCRAGPQFETIGAGGPRRSPRTTNP